MKSMRSTWVRTAVAFGAQAATLFDTAAGTANATYTYHPQYNIETDNGYFLAWIVTIVLGLTLLIGIPSVAGCRRRIRNCIKGRRERKGLERNPGRVRRILAMDPGFTPSLPNPWENSVRVERSTYSGPGKKPLRAVRPAELGPTVVVDTAHEVDPDDYGHMDFGGSRDVTTAL